MAKIYRVEHYNAGKEYGPTADYLAAAKAPAKQDAAKACGISWDEEGGDEIDVHVEKVHGGPIVTLEQVDWELLRAQKLVLVRLADNRARVTLDEQAALNGLINLLDEIQDQAVDYLGEEQIFGVHDD